MSATAAGAEKNRGEGALVRTRGVLAEPLWEPYGGNFAVHETF